MAQVRLLTGRFLKVDGSAVQDFEGNDIPTGEIESIPVTVGNAGCRLEIGNFLPRL